MPFRLFVSFLDRLQADKVTPTQRREIIVELVGIWRKKCGNDIFPCFRLLLPDRDITRVFQLKEKRLASELIKILRIDPKSEDGKAMLKWKDGASVGVGNFARRCRENIFKRQGKKEYSNLDLDQINDYLDQLALSSDKKGDAQQKIIEKLLQQMNAHEMYWLIKIIIKSMKIHLSEKTVLSCWHPSAYKLFNITSDLKRVCWQLCDVSVTVSTTEVSPFLCFKPQMAAYGFKDYTDLLERIGVRTFYIEEKIDGERIQLHMKNGEFRFYSRRGHNRTNAYGHSYNSNGSFTPFLKGFVNDNIKSIILDGELVSWNETEGCIEGFGLAKGAMVNLQDLGEIFGVKGVRSFTFSEIHDRDNDDDDEEDEFQPSNYNRPRDEVVDRWKRAVETAMFKANRHGFFLVYDLLYLNGVSLLAYPLRERRRALNAVINPIPRYLEILEQVEGSTIQDIDKRFLEIMEKGGEGLVVKNPEATYGLNVRDNSWIKVKPEYIDTISDSLDLLIIGGYYGNGNRAGKLSSFLCGLRVSNKEEEDEFLDEQSVPKYFSFCKVGTGFTGQEYELIRTLFDGKIFPYDPKNPNLPPCLEMGSQTPDIWIHPKDSIVIEVKGSQVNYTTSYRANMTLRFPRYSLFRHDKNWRNAMTINQVHSIQEDSISNRQKREEELQKAKQKKKTAVVHTKKAKLSVITTKTDPTHFTGPLQSSILQNRSFYILSSQRSPTYMTQEDIGKLVQTNGGKVIKDYQNLQDQLQSDPKSVFIVADLHSVAVTGFISKQPQLSIIRPLYITESLNHKELLPLEPRHLLVSSGQELYYARCHVDRYGDAYYNTTTSISDFQSLLGRLVPSKLELSNNPDEFHNSLKAFQETFQQIFHSDPTPRSLIFANVVMYFDFEETTLAYISQGGMINFDDEDEDYPWMPSKLVCKLDAKTELSKCQNYAQYGGAVITNNMLDPNLTTIICSSKDPYRARALRGEIIEHFGSKQIYFVNTSWITTSWKEQTRLPEEHFPVPNTIDFTSF